MVEHQKIELAFVQILKDAGVTENELRLFISHNERNQFGKRLMPFIRTFAKEALVDVRRAS